MVIGYAFVKDCNDYGRVTGAEVPGGKDVNVGSGSKFGGAEVAFVHEVPLVLEASVVEARGGSAGKRSGVGGTGARAQSGGGTVS